MTAIQDLLVPQRRTGYVSNWPGSDHRQRSPPAGRVSDIRLLRHFQRVVDFNSKIPDGILQLGVTQQQLHRPQVFRPAVD